MMKQKIPTKYLRKRPEEIEKEREERRKRREAEI